MFLYFVLFCLDVISRRPEEEMKGEWIWERGEVGQNQEERRKKKLSLVCSVWESNLISNKTKQRNNISSNSENKQNGSP